MTGLPRSNSTDIPGDLDAPRRGADIPRGEPVPPGRAGKRLLDRAEAAEAMARSGARRRAVFKLVHALAGPDRGSPPSAWTLSLDETLALLRQLSGARRRRALLRRLVGLSCLHAETAETALLASRREGPG